MTRKKTTTKPPNKPGIYLGSRPTDDELQAKQRRNNPTGESKGHFTGRCARCGSKDLWDDNLAYGCNDCGAIYCG